MDKHEHVITLSAGTKDQLDQLISSHKSKVEIDILDKLWEVGGINSDQYINELKKIYSILTHRRSL